MPGFGDATASDGRFLVATSSLATAFDLHIEETRGLWLLSYSKHMKIMPCIKLS